jgi:hypothetical protein
MFSSPPKTRAPRVTLEDIPGIERHHLAQGRRALTFSVGDMHFRVLEIPASVITSGEWYHFQRARQSYAKMWGDTRLLECILEDDFDGRAPNSPYDTYHYLAQVAVRGRGVKYLTMRKVGFRERSAGNHFDGTLPRLPQDISFWQVRRGSFDQVRSLADVLRECFRQGKFGSPLIDGPLQTCAISRTGTYTSGLTGSLPIDRESSGIALALIQVAATDHDAHSLWISQLCVEFQEKALSVRDVAGQLVMLDFAKTSVTLGLPPTDRLCLDNRNPEVRELKLQNPGYWLDNPGAAKVLKGLAHDGLLTADEFPPTCGLRHGGSAIPGGLEETIDLLVQPRNFKYLLDLIHTPGSINRRLSGEELRHRLITEAGDGPFSSTVVPRTWRRSALKLVTAAQEKYSSSLARGHCRDYHAGLRVA